MVGLVQPFVGQWLSPGLPLDLDRVDCSSLEEIDMRINKYEEVVEWQSISEQIFLPVAEIVRRMVEAWPRFGVGRLAR